jgi:hypothetical protein
MVTTSDDVDNVDAFAAVESLRAALGGAGIVLASPAADPATPSRSLVDLGRVRADVAMRLAHPLHQKEPGRMTTTLPIDTRLLREAARHLLAEDAGLPPETELDTLTLQLRGHLALTIPVVEDLAERFPEDDVPRACAHSAVMAARVRLNREPGRTFPSRIAYAQRLARSVNALCDHYENLSSKQPAIIDPGTAAFLRLADHCLTCPTCQTRDEETGANANLSCPDAAQLYGAYRRAVQWPAAAPGRRLP